MEELTVRHKSVSNRHYLLLSQRSPSMELRLKRPNRFDPKLLLCVPGTYTSPEGQVEGAVIESGKIVRDQAMPWEGLLSVRRGTPTVSWQKQRLGKEALQRFAQGGGSLLQGHLLVGEGKPRPLKPSPLLERRALFIGASGSFAVVESEGPVELGVFAQDLVALGARAAMNLDMGRWSEGFYRVRKGSEPVTLGKDFRSTAKQTNWLVLVAQ